MQGLEQSIQGSLVRPKRLGKVIYSCFDKGCPTKSVKAYATMSTGIVGSKSLALLHWGLRRFSNNEQERTNTGQFVLFPSTTLKHLEVHSSNRKNHNYTHNNFRHCRVSFSLFVRADLHVATLLHATGVRHELFRVDQNYNSVTTVVYVKKLS